uniref:penicillin-binding protein 1C n=1 Tax=Stappia sp. TaxID=1870903 RepID=UPI003BACD3FB
MRETKGDDRSSGAGRAGKRRFSRLAHVAFGLAAAVLVAGVAGAGWLAWSVRAVPDDMVSGKVTVSRSVIDRNGLLLRAFQTPDDRWRLAITPQEVDPRYLEMLQAYEDRRFRDHVGVDPRALVRAAVQLVTSGRVVSGASTLTMQTARLLMEGPTRSLSAKWHQIVLALALESNLDKDAILTLYLTRAPFGGNIEGVRAASLAWFGKEPARLTPAEAALLVALPQSPEARRPDRFPDAARAARDRVLQVMVTRDVLSEEEARAASREDVPRLRRDVPLVAAHAARDALARHPQAEEIRLTLDGALQGRLEKLAASRAARTGKRVSLAILVADHRTGEVLAHVGSAGLLDEARRGHVDMTHAVRSPGSTLKPLIYGLAFEEGIAHPDSLIDDRPVTLAGYSPTNFDMSFQGTVRVAAALQASLNVPAVELLDAVGPARFVARLRASGATPRFPPGEIPGLAAALGGFGMTLDELVALYGALARGGEALTLVREPEELERARLSLPRRVLSQTAAWRIGEILSEVPPPDTANGEGIAYKTGTSYGYRDAWAIGYDGRHVVGVWVGRADGTPIPGITGYLTAAPVLFDVFQRISPERVRLPQRPRSIGVEDRVPAPLTHARTRNPRREAGGAAGPEIFSPPDGATVDLGLGLPGGGGAPLTVKLRRGRAPYVWLANGAPVESGPFARSVTIRPDGPGTTVISVIDADGRSARVTLDLR